MPVSNKRPKVVIDFDEAMKYPPIAVPADKKRRRKKKERQMSSKLNLKKMKAALRTQHGGPGPHKDGSPQSVHGKKGAGGGGSSSTKKPRPSVSYGPGRPDVSKRKNPIITRKTNPGLMDRIASRDTGQKLAYGFKVGDAAWAVLENGKSSEIGILKHYEDDHFYLDLDQGITEVYKTKLRHEFE